MPFYSDDAVLRGTLSPTVRSDQAALREYFVTAFKVVPSLKVAFGDQLIRVYGKTSARKRRRLSQRLEQFVLDLKRVNAHQVEELLTEAH